MTTEIFTLAHVPDELAKEWLQHLRDFDVTHPGCRFEVLADGPGRSFAETVNLLTLHPELPVRAVWPRKKA